MILPQPSTKFVSAKEAVLVAPWEITTRAGVLRVLPGAITDGASVPELIDGLPGYHHFEGDTMPAACAHDMLYASQLCDRKTADFILFDLLIDNGVSSARAGAFYNAVHLFGDSIWSKHCIAALIAARRLISLTPA
jgi:hypothetical protein